MKNRLLSPIALVVVFVMIASIALSACTPQTPAPGAGATGLLATIKQRGKMVVSTDPNYKPQSFLNDKGELDGFDIDVSKEVAKRLGVNVEFTTPAWELIVAGNWGGRWDVSIGSMTITPDRAKVLYFSVPYYYTPAQFAVAKDSPIQTIDDINGKTVCVGSGTTYESYLNGNLTLEGETILKQVTGAKVFGLQTDQECVQSVQAGRRDFDAILTAQPTVESAIQSGAPIRKVGNPVYYEDLAAAFDKNVADSQGFVDAVSKAITDMHNDGTLTTLSKKWYGVDLTTKAK